MPFDTPHVLALIVSGVLPLVVGLVTKESWFPGLKSVLLAALTGVSGVLGEWQSVATNHQSFDWKSAVVTAGIGWAIAVATHYGLWKPTGTTQVAQQSVVRDTYLRP